MDKANKRDLARAYKDRTVVGAVCAITCKENGKKLLKAEPNVDGAKNKFSFFTSTGACPELVLAKDWAKYGKDAFEFEVLEALKSKPEQTTKEFKTDLEMLVEMWKERLGPNGVY